MNITYKMNFITFKKSNNNQNIKNNIKHEGISYKVLSIYKIKETRCKEHTLIAFIAYNALA